MNTILKLSALDLVSAGQPVLALGSELYGRTLDSVNPILPGYFSNPSVVQVDGMLYIYAEIDPLGCETLGCRESEDLCSWMLAEGGPHPSLFEWKVR